MLTDAKIAAIKAPEKGQIEYPDNKVTGLRLRVGTSGKKTWTVRRRVGDKLINRKVGTYPSMGLASAREAAERLIAMLERDGDAAALDRTFGAVAALWLDSVAKEKNKSWRNQKRVLELHVDPSWKDRLIANIKKGDVRELIDGIEGKVLPNRVLATIRPIFRWAAERDWIEFSPADHIAKPKSEAERDRVLDMTEIAKIWNAAGLLGYPFGPYVRALILTAQRRSEVAKMRWKEIDEDEATWTIGGGDTKSGRANLVPLSPLAIAELDPLPELGDFVFTSTGEAPIGQFSKAKQKIDEFVAAKGEPLEAWRFHDIRRSAATHMVRLGVTETIVGRVLNHAPQGVTARVYALHSYAPEKRHALDTWAAEIGRAVMPDRGDNVVPING